MRALIIGKEATQDIARVKEYAELNPLKLHTVIRSVGRPETAIGNNENHVCLIRIGYKVVYSIEEQSDGNYRHLSVSVDKKGRTPSPQALEMLMKEFGFIGGLKGDSSIYTKVWTEDFDGGHIAINVLQSK